MKSTLILILGVLLTVISLSASAQKQWSLKECIDYAIENNIAVQQTELAVKEREVYLDDSKKSRLPSLNSSLGNSFFFGRAQSRAGIYTDNNQMSSSFGLGLNAPIYEGSRIKNQILSNELNLRAMVHGYEKAKEDLSLNIVSLYMQILFSKELLRVSDAQFDLSKEFADRSKILFENGRASESEYYESLSLMAKDKLTVVETNSELSLRLLDLAQALNLPDTKGFDIVTTEITTLDDEYLNTLTSSQQVYDIAVVARPSILSEQFRLRSFEQQLKVVKSSFFPSVGFSAGYNNSYYYSFTDDANKVVFLDQLKRNGTQSLGISVSIPIFNKLATRNQVKLARLNIQNQTFTVENEKIKLQKEIEKSYQNAEASRQAYLASTEAFNAAQIAFKFEEQKSEAGRSTIYDFNESKTRLISSESELVRAKYEFLFNKKILDFYSGVSLVE